MKRVRQVANDDCFAACLASLLDMDLADVPNYGRFDQQRQLILTQRWLRRLGLTYLEISLRDQRPVAIAPVRGVLSVEVPGCDHLHAIVAEYRTGRFRVIHDPAGSCRWGRKALFGWLMPLTVPKPKSR